MAKATKSGKPNKKKKSFISRFFKWVVIAVIAVVVLLIAATVAIWMIVNKQMVQSTMEKQLHRQVRIGEVKIGILSAISGIEVQNVRISNFKDEKTIAALKDKPVAEADLFAGMKSFKFKVSFPPLLKKQVVLKELMIYTPQINVVRFKDGQFNFSDLLVPKKGAEVKKEEPKKEEAKKEEPSKPLSVDSLPVAINIGSIGMQDGVINFTDMSTEQKIQIYKATAKVYDIQIDPKDLDKKDNIKLKVFLGIKTIGRSKSGSVKSFDMGLDINGTVIPFDKKSRLLDPEVSVKVGSSYGTVTGLQVFNEMIAVDALKKYSGKFDFLSKDIVWKNAFLYAWYKANILKIKDATLKTDDYGVTFGGDMNTASSALDFKSNIVLESKHTDGVKKQIAKNADKLIKGKVRDYVKADKVADNAVKPMLNDKNQISLKYDIKGTTSKPKAVLTDPKLPTLEDVIKKEAGNLGDKAKDVVKDKAKEKADVAKDKAADKTKTKVKGLLKR